MKHNKTVTYVWDPACCKDHVFGFGDIVRGMISTYIAATHLKCNMEVKVNHPMVTFLKNMSPPSGKDIRPVYITPKPGFQTCMSTSTAVWDYIRCNDNPVIMTNDFYPGWNNPGHTLPGDVTEYIKHTFKLKDEYETIINKTVNQLPEVINTLYIRTGDSYMVENNAKTFPDIVISPDLTTIITDNSELKTKYNQLYTTPTSPAHSGHHNLSSESVLDMLIDLHVLCNSHKIHYIHYYSTGCNTKKITYPPGLAMFANKIHNVPLYEYPCHV